MFGDFLKCTWNMLQVIFWLILNIATKVQAGTVHFPFHNVTTHVCSDVGSDVVIDKHAALDGTSPLKYTISGNTTVFRIDTKTGIISVEHTLTEENVTDHVLCKHVTDKHGGQAEMLIDVAVVTPVLTAKACPKIQELRVREIAPVGEEVGMVECISNIPDTGLLAFETPLSVSSRALKKSDPGASSPIVPFNITSRGVVVVSQPLVYRNNIHDINIVNVTMVYLRGGGDPGTNCNRTETKVTLKVIVEKSSCDSKWTYEMKKHVYLAVAPILTMSNSGPEDCMSVCNTNDTMLCHGFNYNVLKEECSFLNETEYTLSNTTKPRLGMLLYRKYCKTETLPMAVLRNTIIQVDNSTSLNASTGADILRKMLSTMEGTMNMSSQDVVLASVVFLKVVDKLQPGNASKQQLEYILQICGQLFDFLILKANGIVPKKKMNGILVTFDKLLETLSLSVQDGWNTLTTRSQQTTFHIQRFRFDKGQNQTSAVALNLGRSGIRLKGSSQNTTGKHTTIVTGTIDGLGDIITPTLVTETGGNLSMALQGQIVSVVMDPTPNDSFEIHLDISTNKRGEWISSGSRICAFLRSHGVWDTEGCWLVKYNRSHTRCQCSHLTNFAVLMQVTQFQLEEIHVTSLEILTVTGCCLSIAALSTTVVVLLWFRLRSERYMLLLHLSVAVVLAQVVFLSGIDAVHNKIVCRLVAILLHYLYLCVFTLMLAEGIHLFHKLHRAFAADDNLNMLLLLGWGSPFIIVSMSILSDADGYSTQRNCWLSTDGAIWAFVGPALTIIAINLAVLVMIIRTFLGVAIVAKKTEVQKFKASVKATAVLLPLLGITWMFGVVAVNNNTVVFQYIFALLNSLQGLFIFLFHVVFNEDVKKACSQYKSNQVTSTESLPKSTSLKKLHRKANLYSTTTSV